MPTNEIKEFFYQLSFITSVSGNLLGLEYPKPFSMNSVRETKALLFVIFTGIFMIILNFNKKINLDFSTKIIISTFFISSVIFFQTGLMRTDTPHIKAASGLYMFIFYFGILYLVFYKLQNAKIINLIKEHLSKYIFIIFFCFFSIWYFNILNISNIINFKSSVRNLIMTKDDLYLNDQYKSFVNYYSKITKNDECVQILSDDIILPYLLKKPSCTQFFIPGHILIGWNENKFIDQIKKSKSKFILYSSPFVWINNKKNMPNVVSFIKSNYHLYNDYMGWQIYKKN